MATATTLTTAQLEELRRRLEGERDRILAVLRAPAAGGTDPDQQSELEEAAQRETERARRVDVEARERVLLGEVERALAKLASGQYGASERTGEPIPYARLSVIPWAREAIDE